MAAKEESDDCIPIRMEGGKRNMVNLLYRLLDQPLDKVQFDKRTVRNPPPSSHERVAGDIYRTGYG